MGESVAYVQIITGFVAGSICLGILAVCIRNEIVWRREDRASGMFYQPKTTPKHSGRIANPERQIR